MPSAAADQRRPAADAILDAAVPNRIDEAPMVRGGRGRLSASGRPVHRLDPGLPVDLRPNVRIVRVSTRSRMGARRSRARSCLRTNRYCSR